MKRFVFFYLLTAKIIVLCNIGYRTDAFFLLSFFVLLCYFVILCLLSKIHKRLVNVPGRPVISNYSIPTEKASKFLDHHLQPIMRSGVSYIKDTNGFLSKLKNLKKVTDNAILVTTNVVRLYPSIPHNEGFKILKKQLDFDEKSVPTEDLVKTAEFVFKNNYF